MNLTHVSIIDDHIQWWHGIAAHYQRDMTSLSRFWHTAQFTCCEMYNSGEQVTAIFAKIDSDRMTLQDDMIAS